MPRQELSGRRQEAGSDERDQLLAASGVRGSLCSSGETLDAMICDEDQQCAQGELVVPGDGRLVAMWQRLAERPLTRRIASQRSSM